MKIYYISLIEKAGGQILVRLDTIVSVRETADGTLVSFSAGNFMDGATVKESVHEVAIKMSGVED